MGTKRTFGRKISAALLTAVMAAGSVVPVCAATVNAAGTDGGNVQYAYGVTAEMSNSSFWNEKSGIDSQSILMTKQEIAALNQEIMASKETNCINMVTGFTESYNADDICQSLASEEPVNKDIFVDGEKVDRDKYYADIKKAISETGFKGQQKTRYAVSTCIADLRSWPESRYVGYSASDMDDEFELASLCVNEPFVIRQKCEINGKVFYWGYSAYCTGWIAAEQLGIAASKDEWMSSWRTEETGNDFLVVTQDKIVLDMQDEDPALSRLVLNVGTMLKMVPKSEIPEKVLGRSSWNNYVVYVPVRDDKGNYRRAMALIPEYNSVSIGYEDMTGENILKIAFSCLGQRYGWGGMYESLDCSGYVRNVYRCFGLRLPRNTSWQTKIPGHAVSLEGMTAEQKATYISQLPAGTPLYISGHTFMYTGTVDGIPYCISAIGSTIDSDEETANVRSVYSVAINPMTVKRKNLTTWLDNIHTAVVFENEVPEPMSVIFCDMQGYEYANDAVKYVSSKGLFQGVDANSFGPGIEMSRNMLLTVLARSAGQDTSGGSVWYEPGVNWAVENGIADGNELESGVTREELAVMLYKTWLLNTDDDALNTWKQENIGMDGIKAFTDADKISENAREAVNWAVRKGIITGMGDGTIAPAGNITRAQVAIMIMRYLEL